MSDLLATLKSQSLLADGAMGSYLFKLTGRLSETNHVYEAFNAEQPELIRKVHTDYLEAGARCLKTNTFGANTQQFRAFGLEHRVAELNRRGVRLAREAISVFEKQHPESGPFFVLASVGPTSEPLDTAFAVAECYHQQLDALAEAGADALLLETFVSLKQLELLINLIKTREGMPPVIAQVSIRGTEDDPDPVDFVNRMAALGVAVAGVNCCAPWDARAFVEAVQNTEVVCEGILPLVVMPNAGGFQRIGNRFMTTVNPEAAGKLARSFSDCGVRLLGGCCEMHPPHIEEMHNYLQSRSASARASEAAVVSALPPAGVEEKRANGPFSRKLKSGEFVVSLEAVPPRGTNDKVVQRKIDLIAKLAESGLVDAVDITDGSRGIPLFPPGDFIHLVRERLGWDATTGDQLELIPHFTGRDLNVMGIQGRLAGYHANRIHNVLFVTGDPPKMSPTYPRSTAVFDLDSVSMIRLTHSCLNAGVDFGGVKLGKHDDPRMHFTIGSGVELEAQDMKREQARLQQKIDHGVDYIMTQPAFSPEPLAVLEKFRDQTACIIGVMVLSNYEHAQRMANVPGVVIPDALLQRFASFEQVADQAKLGLEFAAEQIRGLVDEGWAGVYLMGTAAGDGVFDVLRSGLGK